LNLTIKILDIMSHKRLILLVLVAVVIAWVGSCKPKATDDVEPLEEDSTVLIARTCILLEERINDALYRAYEYDSTRRLMRVYEYTADLTLNRLAKRYTFEYDPKDSTKIVRMRETNLAVRDQSFFYDIDYDAQGKYKYILPFRIYNSGPRALDTVQVFYDADNRISEMKAAMLYHYIYDYDSLGNVKTWSLRRAEQPTDSVLATYTEYDAKINLFQFSRGAQLMNLIRGTLPNRRNPLKSTVHGQNIESIYEYNAKGLPTQATTSYRMPGDTLSRTLVYNFQLDCK
jgi:hypothetical protein